MDSNNTLIIAALAIGVFMFLVIAIPKLMGDEKRSKDHEESNKSNPHDLIIVTPSQPASNIPVPPEVKPHQHMLGPGGTQWIYN